MKQSLLFCLIVGITASCGTPNTEVVDQRDQYAGIYKGALSRSSFADLPAEISLRKSDSSTSGVIINFQGQSLRGSFSQNSLYTFSEVVTIKDTAYDLSGMGKVVPGNVMSLRLSGYRRGSNKTPVMFDFVGYK